MSEGNQLNQGEQQDNQEILWEEAHLSACREIILKNIARYQNEFEERHTEVTALHQARNSGDVELYHQLMSASSLEEQAYLALRKNQTALSRPYFGRIDYLDKSYGKDMKVYIGKHGIFQDKSEILIADWRAPISGVYYENELGEGEYGLADEAPIAIDLRLKRTYDISDGRLLGFYDSDIAANDELLIQYLSRNKDMVLREIISTIQKEQNAIIRETPFANLIVQGVAGSGKTTVAIHRISYLLYNYRERFQSNEYCIVGGNNLLLNYIAGALPELDVPNIKMLRMDQLLINLCEKEWLKRYRQVPVDATGRERCTLTFIRSLERFLLEKRTNIVNCKALTDKQFGTILTKSANITLLKENPEFSIDKLLTILDERVKERIEFLMSGWDEAKIQARQKIYAGYYKEKKPKQSAAAIYQEFLQQWTQNTHADETHLSACAVGNYDIYDIAALALIHYRVHRMTPNEEFGLMFLDEAQDFGVSIYYVLKKVLPDTYFTIMGDVSQNINYETGINDWTELNRVFLTDEKDKFLQLRKSYRNTVEISEFASRLLAHTTSAEYLPIPVIRHGMPVCREEYWSDVEMAQRIADLLPKFKEKQYHSNAVICRTEAETQKAIDLLKEFLPKNIILRTADVLAKENDSSDKDIKLAEQEKQELTVLPLHLVKGLEFDGVILWNPNLKQGLDSPSTAKLLYVAATRALHELYIFQS